MEYLPYYTEREHFRHTVRPGLSGLAQVNGRNAIQWSEKFELDYQYVSKITFWGDMKIIFQTVYKAFKREGIVDSKEKPVKKLSHIMKERAESIGSNKMERGGYGSKNS